MATVGTSAEIRAVLVVTASDVATTSVPVGEENNITFEVVNTAADALSTTILTLQSSPDDTNWYTENVRKITAATGAATLAPVVSTFTPSGVATDNFTFSVAAPSNYYRLLVSGTNNAGGFNVVTVNAVVNRFDSGLSPELLA